MNPRAILRHPLTPVVIATAGIVMIAMRPVASTFTRAGTLVCLAVLIAGLLLAVRRNRIARRFTVGALILIVAAFACPFGGTVPAAVERDRIVRAAKSYEGVRYYWGGESRRGIDCSGLVRCAYRDAALESAWRSFSPEHLRRAAWLWLRDSTAAQFETRAPIRGRRITLLPNMKGVTPPEVLPGDFALVGGGSHVLLYLGDNRWIQADPATHTVHEDVATVSRDPWLNSPALVLRPEFLEE